MNNEDKQFAHIQKMVNEIMEPIREMQKMILEPLKPIRDMQEQIQAQYDKTFAPIRQINQRYRDILTSNFSDPLFQNISYMLSDTNFSQIERASEMLQHAFSDSFADADFSVFTRMGAEAFNTVTEPHFYYDDHIELSETFADSLAGIDDSLNFPEPNAEHIVCVNKADLGTYISVFSLILTIISICISIGQSHSSTELSKQQHAEIMLEEKKQTREQEKQTECLKQIAENTASSNNVDQRSPEVSKSPAQ